MTTWNARRWRSRLAALIGTAVITGAFSAAPARAERPADPAPRPGDVILDTDAKPVIRWSVPDRYTASWNAYNPSTSTYDSNVINPPAWSLNLDGCASTSVHRISSYEFKVAQIGTTWTRTYVSSRCSLPLRNVLPAQGLYRVTLTLHTTWTATLSGVSLPTDRIVGIRDYLIVSMGDSLASGEGNPDVPGSYSISIDWPLDISIDTNRAAIWKDSRCHRSAKSGPALAAKSYEDASPYTSVTFVSVACSGAEIRHLVSDRYGGIAPVGSSTVPPQVDAVASLLGPNSPRGGRQIDALLVSAGINNLGFSDIIKRCLVNNNFASGHTSCVTSDHIADMVDDLTRQYAYLAFALAWKMPSTREVYLNNYPSNVFRGGACGVLAGNIPGVGHIPSKGIDSAEAEEMNRWGLALSAKITKATDAFRGDPYRWNRVPDLAGPFTPHAYCDNPSWFRSLEESLAGQGDLNGTAHPNPAGHLQYASLLRRAIVLNQATQPVQRVTITLQAMKASALPGAPPLIVDPVFWRYQNDPYGLTRRFSVPRTGTWTWVPASVGTYTYDMYVAPASPRHATAVNVVLGHILPISYGRSQNYGVGNHQLTHPTGRLSVLFRIDSVRVGPPENAGLPGS
jgi:hypothetical protein